MIDISEKLHRQEGFTLVELVIVVIILGIIISIATLNYSSISQGINMNAARKQIEAAMNRAKTAARQENATYQLVFYTDTAGNGNSYEFFHNEYNSLTGTWTMTPVDRSVSGEEVTSEAGHTYIVLTGGVKLTGCTEIPGNKIIIGFSPSGTTMTIQGSDDPGGGIPPTTSATITLNLLSGSKTGSVAINGMGDITLN